MSNNKLLKENTIRRFMKLANVENLTDTFIVNKQIMEQAEEEAMAAEEPGLEEPAVEDDMDMEDDMDAEEDMELDMEEEDELGAADISLTEEEAQLLIDLGERLKEAMGEEGEEDLDMEDDLDVEDDMEDDMPDEEVEAEEADVEAPEEEMAAGAGVYEGRQRDAIINEVLRRVTKRIVSERIRRKK